MPKIPHVTQRSDQIVDIGGWTVGDDQSIFPVGSKPKRLVLCPQDAPFPFLIGGHRYLFKVASGWREQQLWSEVIAYELAKLCGFWVPPCFAAYDSQKGQSGVLMEFFYGYPDDPDPLRFVHGADILQRLDKDYHSQTGRPHSISQNIILSRTLGVPNARDWWARTTAFDALIGNTDRHAENWGVMRTVARAPHLPWKLAVPFDHGTSLGYEVAEDDLGRRSDAASIKGHLSKGRHHCTWLPSTDRKGQAMFELCAEQCAPFERLKAVMDQVIPQHDEIIERAVSQWVDFDLPVKFSPARAKFVMGIIRARRDELSSRLGL